MLPHQELGVGAVEAVAALLATTVVGQDPVVDLHMLLQVVLMPKPHIAQVTLESLLSAVNQLSVELTICSICQMQKRNKKITLLF